MDTLTDHLKALQIELLTTIKEMEAIDASTAAAAHYSALCVPAIPSNTDRDIAPSAAAP